MRDDKMIQKNKQISIKQKNEKKQIRGDDKVTSRARGRRGMNGNGSGRRAEVGADGERRETRPAEEKVRGAGGRVRSENGHEKRKNVTGNRRNGEEGRRGEVRGRRGW